MTQEEFLTIQQWDIIKFQRDDDDELETGAVLKKGRSQHLVAGIDNDRGFWHQVSAKDVQSVIKYAPGAAIKDGIIAAIKNLEIVRDMI
ncbi:MAG: hypothetical protein ACYTEW_27125 [Planctomycetota bacterium]|jgi:phage tail sheath protein FI